MANDIALGIVIGGAISATFGRAITETSSRIVSLRKTANETRLWQRTIGETVKLQDEFRRLHAAGDRAADPASIDAMTLDEVIWWLTD